MSLNILGGLKFQIYLSANDLPICFYQVVPIIIGKNFVKAIMVHL